jgi:hypothetical protein
VSPLVVLGVDGPGCGAGVTPVSVLRGMSQIPKAPRMRAVARPTASFHRHGVAAGTTRRPAAKSGELTATSTRRKTDARNHDLRAIGASLSSDDLRIPPWDGRAAALKE